MTVRCHCVLSFMLLRSRLSVCRLENGRKFHDSRLLRPQRHRDARARAARGATARERRGCGNTRAGALHKNENHKKDARERRRPPGPAVSWVDRSASRASRRAQSVLRDTVTVAERHRPTCPNELTLAPRRNSHRHTIKVRTSRERAAGAARAGPAHEAGHPLGLLLGASLGAVALGAMHRTETLAPPASRGAASAYSCSGGRRVGGVRVASPP